MLSLSKILLTLAVIGAVIFVVWALARRGAAKPLPSRGRRRVVKAVDLEACPACGIFMQPGGKACGRTDCPYIG